MVYIHRLRSRLALPHQHLPPRCGPRVGPRLPRLRLLPWLPGWQLRHSRTAEFAGARFYSNQARVCVRMVCLGDTQPSGLTVEELYSHMQRWRKGSQNDIHLEGDTRSKMLVEQKSVL